MVAWLMVDSMLMFKRPGKVRKAACRAGPHRFNGGVRTFSARGIAALLLGLGMCSVAQASAPMTEPKPVAAGTWRTLAAASGVAFGSTGSARQAVQIVCDAHCPYCARLYRTLRTDYPGLPVRWVPIAYFQPDSGRVAAAILSSPDPAAALDRNYQNYDTTARRGGYQADPGRGGALPQPNAALKQHWKAWGGYTPMVFVRDEEGTVFQATGATDAFLEAALGKAPGARRP